METYISEELIKGNPSEILERVTKEMATQIIYMSSDDYENTCCNMRLMADLFEILFEIFLLSNAVSPKINFSTL